MPRRLSVASKGEEEERGKAGIVEDVTQDSMDFRQFPLDFHDFHLATGTFRRHGPYSQKRMGVTAVGFFSLKIGPKKYRGED